MAAILQEPVTRLSEAGRQRPHGLEAIVLKCLEKSPERRFQSARDLAQALKALMGVVPGTQTPEAAQAETAFFRQTPQPGTQVSAQPVPSVAVLPFRNLSSDLENEYFSDGLAEELINALTRVEGLHVAARTSAFAFKNRNEDIRGIGEQLNVRTVLEGSVRKSGNRLRISAQLVNVADGYQMWSETYNRDLEDVFAIQDEIASSIAKALQVILGDKAKKAIEKVAATNVKAYDCYLRGVQFFHQFRRKGLAFAEQLFTQAIGVDPQYARAHAGVANCHSLLFSYWNPDPNHLVQADQASRKALELDPDLAEAHYCADWLWPRTNSLPRRKRNMRLLFASTPRCLRRTTISAGLAWHRASSRRRRGFSRKPASSVPKTTRPRRTSAAFTSPWAKKPRASPRQVALDTIEKHLALNPDDARALYLGASCWCDLGQPAKGLQWAERALAMDPEEPVTLYNVACVNALQGQAEKALDCLEAAVKHGFAHKAWIENDSDLQTLRSLPRYEALLQKL